MPQLRRLSLLLALGSCLAVTTPALAVEDCATVSMTVSAQLSNDPGFEGLYKYTVTGSWDVTRFGVSHIDVFLALENLECICDPRVVKFGSPAGTSTGSNENGPCTSIYTGLYQCMGDPSVPDELHAPTIKFSPGDACKPGVTGNGTWSFYSPFPPAPFSVYPDAVAIKHGQGVCTGDLVGQMPMGDCTTPAVPVSWGSMKAMYR
jgi:hypothetical protein